MESHDYLRSILIYLLAAVLSVPITKRLGLGSVIGYLVSGVVIGPSGFGLIASIEDVLHFSEFGVVLLLFLIGLELNPKRLWELKRPIFGMGGAQVIFCIAVLTPVFTVFLAPGSQGFTLQSKWIFGLVAAMGFAMSSTALAIQLLKEKNLLALSSGQASFAVLLFQDLAVIPLMAILPLLALNPHAASDSEVSRWIPIFKSIAALLAVVVGGRYLLRPLFRLVAGTDIREIFTAFSLVLILGTAYLMQQVGLSMALGTFLAGVLLADSEFRHELEVDIEPFKGLLLGLFFIAVGMSMDLTAFMSAPLLILSMVALLLSLKTLILFGVARLFGYKASEASVFSFALSQGGEFAFVLYGVAAQAGIFSPRDAGLLNISVAISMAATPFLFKGYEKWIQPRLRAGGPDGSEFSLEREEVKVENPVILAGYGRIGQVVGRILHAQGIGVTILEQDPSQIEVVRRFGWKAFYGDVSRIDLLTAAGAAQAKLLILAIDNMEAAQKTIRLVKENYPHLKIIVRAESRLDAYIFMNMETPTVRATFAPGLELGEEALKLLGTPAHESHVIVERFKRYDINQVNLTYKYMSDMKTLVALSHQSKEELSRIMENDNRKRNEIADEGWG